MSATELMKSAGMTPDDWQRRVLEERPHRALLRCSRQSGKSTTAAAAGLAEALANAGSTTLILSPSQRQAAEMLHKVRAMLNTMGEPPATVGESALKLELGNGSRVITLPAKEGTVRGYTCSLLICDEAGWIEDALYASVRPMLATVSDARMLCLSTPAGARGWFYLAWQSTEEWERVMVTAYDCPRISAGFLEQERRSMPARRFQSEYLCTWLAAEGSVFDPIAIDAMVTEEVAVL
jgi:hypothetical protein